MDDYQKLVTHALETIDEILPWDLQAEIKSDPELILLDIRETDEFAMMHIENSLTIPRGMLEAACCWNYDDTTPILAQGREQNIVLICRSGNRSVLAAQTMQNMGFQHIRSLKLGIKGWNDSDMPMLDQNGKTVDVDKADKWLSATIATEKLAPN